MQRAMRGIGRFGFLGSVALLMVTLSLTGCGSEDATDVETLDPPAAAVESLLNLRYERSTDASAYAEFLEDPTLAFELAEIALEESQSVLPPTPAWETPYVSVLEDDVADVIVVWVEPEAFGATADEWPAANVFKMTLADESWLTGDAFPLTDEEIPDPITE